MVLPIQTLDPTTVEPTLRGYLAAALTSLPEGSRHEIYELCKLLKIHCRKHGLALYLPFEHTDPEQHKDVPAPEVYAIDKKNVVTSDLVLMLCVAPSYGVGQENELALYHGIPVIYLIKKGCSVSRMLIGSPTRNLRIDYDSAEDLLAKLDETLPSTIAALVTHRSSLGGETPLGVGQRVKDLRTRNEMETATLADMLGVAPEFVSNLEEHPDAENSLSLQHIRRLAVVLRASVGYLLLAATSMTDEKTRRSKVNLQNLAREEDMLYSDYEILWEAYRAQQKEMGLVVAATKNTAVMGKEQWRVSYRKLLEKRNGPELEF